MSFDRHAFVASDLFYICLLCEYMCFERSYFDVHVVYHGQSDRCVVFGCNVFVLVYGCGVMYRLDFCAMVQ